MMKRNATYGNRGRTPYNSELTPMDFDVWAKAVRQQMLEALKRRGHQAD